MSEDLMHAYCDHGSAACLTKRAFFFTFLKKNLFFLGNTQEAHPLPSYNTTTWLNAARNCRCREYHFNAGYYLFRHCSTFLPHF